MGKDFRQKVLREHSDIIKLHKTHSKQCYFQVFRPDLFNPEEFEETGRRLEVLASTSEGQAILDEIHRINAAFYARCKRLKRRISRLLHQGTCYFVTLTFNDETLGSTTDETRRRYVTRFLKSVAPSYVANVDYGSKNGREHYHAVIQFDGDVDMSGWDCNGFSNAKKIASEDDYKPVAKYIAKLTNHAVKETNQSRRAIYSV